MLTEEDVSEGGFHEFHPGVFNNAAASRPENWNIPGKMLEKGSRGQPSKRNLLI